MFIKACIACLHKDQSNFENLLKLDAFYDITQAWNDIHTFYLQDPDVRKFIAAYNKVENPIRQLFWQGRDLVSAEKNITKIIKRETIECENKLKYVWMITRIDVLESWYNWDVDNDDRIFTTMHIFEAVRHGLLEGISAGLYGRRLINDMTANEYAWQYAQDIGGN
jgi:hypothetical protein